MLQRLTDLALAFGPWNPKVLFLALGIFALAFGATRPRILVFGSLAAYSSIMVNSAVIAIPGAVDMRLVAVGLAVYLAMLRRRLPKFGALRRGVFPAAVAFLVIGLALVPTAQSSGTAWSDLFAALICVVYVWILVCAADEQELRGAMWGVALLFTAGSLVYVLGGGGSAIANGRWRGLTTNANTLGTYAAIFFITSRRRDRYWSLPLVISVLLGTASRAPTFALGLIAGPKLLEGTSRRMRRAALVIGLVVAIPIVHSVFFQASDASGTTAQGTGLTRTKNSRADEWADGMQIFKDHPFTGVGVGSQPPMVSSSIISPMTQIGIWAMIPLGLIVAVLITRIRSPETAFRSVFVLLCVHGVFEMWLFAGGSIFFALFLLAGYDPGLHAATRSPEAPQEDDLLELAVGR